MMRSDATSIPPIPSESPALTWTTDEIEQFCWDAGVLTLVGTQGFRKAATDASMATGYRLATISRDKEPFENLFKLSLFVLGDRQCLGRREMKRLVLDVMANRLQFEAGRLPCRCRRSEDRRLGRIAKVGVACVRER